VSVCFLATGVCNNTVSIFSIFRVVLVQIANKMGLQKKNVISLSTLKMEAVSSSKMLVTTYQSIQYDNTDHKVSLLCYENTKSCIHESLSLSRKPLNKNLFLINLKPAIKVTAT
jgi:hypothetical protein